MNLYETLGVDPDASLKDIDKAYRKASLKHHPDRGGDAERFKEINEAYEVLSDPERRQYYDETGQTSKRDDKRQAAERIIAAMVAEAFSQDVRDSIRWMCERIAARRSDHESAKDKLQTGAKKLESRIAAFEEANAKTKNTGSREFILEILRAGLIDINAEIAMHEANAEMLTIALTLLNDLKDGRDAHRTFNRKWEVSTGSYAFDGAFHIPRWGNVNSTG